MLRLWFLILCVIAGAFAPVRADARGIENRTRDFFAFPSKTHQETESQAVELHQEKTAHGYETALGCTQAAENAAVRPGSFSILDWKGYPSSIPKPAGPFQLLEGAEYSAARAQANATNRALHAADESLGGWQLHEIQPVKFGGSPTSMANKMPLPAGAHSEVTTWWNTLMRDLTRKPGAP